MPAERVVDIVPGMRRRWLAEVWEYRDLMLFLAWRDLLLRYRQTVVGVAWSVLRPLLVSGILVLVFSRIARLPGDGAPYTVMVLAALVPWQLFSASLSEAGASLVANPSLVSKVAIPRAVVPLAAVLVAAADAAVVAVLLALVMAVTGCAVAARAVIAPLFIGIAAAAAIGAGLWAAALHVRYRDVRHAMPVLTQVLFYASPIGYSVGIVPESWRVAFFLNPLAGAIGGLRWSLFAGASEPWWPGIGLSAASAAVLLVSGAAYFRATERHQADVI
jgi:lipopolysaccharide transport system permease protein